MELRPPSLILQRSSGRAEAATADRSANFVFTGDGQPGRVEPVRHPADRVLSWRALCPVDRVSRSTAYVFGFENQPPVRATVHHGAGPKPLVRLILPHFGSSARPLRSMDGQLCRTEQKLDDVALPHETYGVPTASI